ncbi:MAG: isoprenylcysteine carboxyl methyltransferase [Bryobacterales bacterium]|nr:isoprenylcysteine carboxyl methyltransferase [Bryobacterales bacterium]
MFDLISGLKQLPGYGVAAVVVMLLYAVQSEVRFGKRARTMRTGPADRRSTLAVSVCAAIPILGFVLAMKANSSFATLLPEWFRGAVLPGQPAIGWAGVVVAACGVGLRLWAVLKLRERYTRTLLIQDEHSIERGGPYRWLRHPGYLGSLLVLNGIALASGNWITLLASLIATLAAYTHRIKVEDEMLVAVLGESYAQYRREVKALIPSLRAGGLAKPRTEA